MTPHSAFFNSSLGRSSAKPKVPADAPPAASSSSADAPSSSSDVPFSFSFEAEFSPPSPGMDYGGNDPVDNYAETPERSQEHSKRREVHYQRMIQQRPFLALEGANAFAVICCSVCLAVLDENEGKNNLKHHG